MDRAKPGEGAEAEAEAEQTLAEQRTEAPFDRAAGARIRVGAEEEAVPSAEVAVVVADQIPAHGASRSQPSPEIRRPRVE